jgi:hypothetical protein
LSASPTSAAVEAGILAFGAYVPQRRLQRAAICAAHAWFAPALRNVAPGERAIADWDEDTITMAVEAGRDCLSGIDRTLIASLSLASTTLPFADRQNAGIVKEALNLSDTVSVLDVTGSQRAATSALIQALHAAAAISTACLRQGDVVYAPRRDLSAFGDGHCGGRRGRFLLCSDAGPARRCRDQAAATVPGGRPAPGAPGIRG